MQRHLSLIQGKHADVWQRAHSRFRHHPHTLWVTNQAFSANETSLCLPASKAKVVLGREFDRVIFDVWSGLDVNALAMVAGTIRAGGALVLLTLSFDEWPAFADPDCKRFLPHPFVPEQVAGHFVRRLIRLLKGVELCPYQEIQADLPPFNTETTQDQQVALSHILDSRQPVVMTADRGRGKSAVLGMAAEQFVQGGLQVRVTAPSRAATDTLFQHAGAYLQASDFIAPDELLQTLPVVDVLLIDEAAAIPVPLLLAMVKHYPRCVFATTLQGYEGSGRGFVLRFQKALSKASPQWQAVRLQRPIRWSLGDRLETVMNRLLMLGAGGGEKGAVTLGDESVLLNHAEVAYVQLKQAELAANEALLRDLFGLLVNAHYQTRPSDLRQMLDAPTLSIHVLKLRNEPVAVALLSREGGLGEELVAAIHAGKRRPHGHLLAQSLTFHAGIEGAACLHGERVMRMAVLPAYQQQGLGRLLLAHLATYARQQGADYLGVSYALTPGLQAFWEGAGFVSVRLGHRKDKASGARSLMQVLGLSQSGIELAEEAYGLYQEV